MRIITNKDGTVDLAATRATIPLKNLDRDIFEYLTESEMDEDGLLEDFPPTQEEEDSESIHVDAFEFWSDPCWAEVPGSMG